MQNKAAVGMHKTVISPDQDETSHIYQKKGKGKTENGFASLTCAALVQVRLSRIHSRSGIQETYDKYNNKPKFIPGQKLIVTKYTYSRHTKTPKFIPIC